jgi:hypothetical protein
MKRGMARALEIVKESGTSAAVNLSSKRNMYEGEDAHVCVTRMKWLMPQALKNYWENEYTKIINKVLIFVWTGYACRL